MRTRAKLVLALLCLLLAMACGGGGGGGGPTTPPPPTPGIQFSASAGGGNPGIALAAGSGSTATALDLEVRASGVNDLYGVAFSLTYPSQQLRYDYVVEGGFLNQNGTVATSLQAAENPPGTIVIGLTRLGAVPGVNGSGVLMTLHFSAKASGGGALAFSRTQAADSHGAPISGFSWTAGSVQVTVAGT